MPVHRVDLGSNNGCLFTVKDLKSMAETKQQAVDPKEVDRAWSTWEGFMQVSKFSTILVILALLLLLGVYLAG